MDHKKSENQFTTSETFDQRIERLEKNFRLGNDEMIISRASLTELLSEATAGYLKSHASDNKVDALVWDGFVRAYQTIFDIEKRS